MHENAIAAVVGADAMPVEPQPRTKKRLKAPTLLEQAVDVFTQPTQLFTRLADTPRWGGALLLVIIAAWLWVVPWSLKVDADALYRPVLEKNGSMPAAQIESVIEITRRFMMPMTLMAVTFRNLFGTLFFGLMFWLVGLGTKAERKPKFLQAVSASAVPGLMLVPYFLMIGVVSALRDVGSQIPDRLAPSGLAFYLRPENPKLYALLAQVDPFIIGFFVMTFLATRHVMRLKNKEAALCTALALVVSLGWRIYFWV
ncbi:MAG: hypothetical protein JO197_16475 [Acidobacteria bacterium]|nr:hypothetical protein [Acidobacteriota bacterium]MBV9069744.1 hypothetical protein [Acidobacteriota bacterium]MBV9475398.1 hypothetical protein [Acidobacteriota bacterium]